MSQLSFYYNIYDLKCHKPDNSWSVFGCGAYCNKRGFPVLKSSINTDFIPALENFLYSSDEVIKCSTSSSYKNNNLHLDDVLDKKLILEKFRSENVFYNCGRYFRITENYSSLTFEIICLIDFVKFPFDVLNNHLSTCATCSRSFEFNEVINSKSMSITSNVPAIFPCGIRSDEVFVKPEAGIVAYKFERV